MVFWTPAPLKKIKKNKKTTFIGSLCCISVLLASPSMSQNRVTQAVFCHNKTPKPKHINAGY